VVPAIAAGCTAVLKPAEQTPFSALALAELAERAGLPAGVFNVTTGEPALVGEILCAHPSVRMLTFTGSTSVGRKLMAQCAPTLKKLSLELGGNAPFIVFEDADLDEAVEGAMASKFRNAGQTCVCANRFLVQESVYEAFMEKLSAAAGQLITADGRTEGAQQGPLVNDAAAERLDDLMRDALGKGATIRCGGNRVSATSRFFQPTVLGATQQMRVANEEIFGPIAPVLSFATEAEAIQLSNDTTAGLAAYVYTNDLRRAWRMLEALEFGIVGINTGVVSTESVPFGGMKQSGLGREGGRHGIEEFTELKYACLGGMGFGR
jgi:succinate-semialdehyde dehydrogenase/glutarate-semialdehyde dehydrogenase